MYYVVVSDILCIEADLWPTIMIIICQRLGVLTNKACFDSLSRYRGRSVLLRSEGCCQTKRTAAIVAALTQHIFSDSCSCARAFLKMGMLGAHDVR